MDVFELLDKHHCNDKLDDKFPQGISHGNSSAKTYIAMLDIFEAKKRYIKAHGKASDYRSEKRYLVQRSEACAITNKTVQATFNNNTYSVALERERRVLNDRLKILKNDRLISKKDGVRSKTKNEIYKKSQSMKSQLEEMNQLKAREQVEVAISMMSPEAKRLLLP